MAKNPPENFLTVLGTYAYMSVRTHIYCASLSAPKKSKKIKKYVESSGVIFPNVWPPDAGIAYF